MPHQFAILGFWGMCQAKYPGVRRRMCTSVCLVCLWQIAEGQVGEGSEQCVRIAHHKVFLISGAEAACR
jgi:hypothetical protein